MGGAHPSGIHKCSLPHKNQAWRCRGTARPEGHVPDFDEVLVRNVNASNLEQLADFLVQFQSAQRILFALQEEVLRLIARGGVFQ